MLNLATGTLSGASGLCFIYSQVSPERETERGGEIVTVEKNLVKAGTSVHSLDL